MKMANSLYFCYMSIFPGDIILVNGKLIDCSEADFDFFAQDGSLYEVIRVMDGCPLFLDDHLLRLRNSCNASGKEMLADKKELEEQIARLVNISGIKNCNIKVSYTYQEKLSSEVHFINSYYPPEELYNSGINCDILNFERDKPGIKQYNQILRKTVEVIKAKSGLYEVLLVDKEGLISEGSKSNVFFIINNQLLTAPESRVLAGITRKYVLDIAHQNNINLSLRSISISELKDVESVFICGTSPKVLQVRSIGGKIYQLDHPVYLEIKQHYDNLIMDYISDHS